MRDIESKNNSVIYTDADGIRKNALVVIPVSASGKPLSSLGMTSLKYVQVPVTSGQVVKMENIPDGTLIALVKVEGGTIRYRDDGVDPTPTQGMPLDAGESMEYDATMTDIRVIAADHDVLINVTFYGVGDAQN